MKKHLNVVGALIIREGKVLAARRGESPYAYVAHKYEFVGGKIEQGESPQEALCRELREELRAEASVGELFETVFHDYPDFCITLSVYRCTLKEGYENTEHEELRWIPLQDLNAADWAPADGPIVKNLRSRHRGESGAFG